MIDVAAMTLWRRYALQYELTLQAYGERGSAAKARAQHGSDDSVYEVSVVDDSKGYWVVIARGRELADTMLLAISRVRSMQPGGPIRAFDDAV
jgi:hypothetical protein